MRQEVIAIVDKAVAGYAPTASDVELLFALDDYAPEAYYLHWGAHQLAWQASAGQGVIYAQIGLDSQPCPGNCHYCSFAKINSSFADVSVLSLDTVLACCQAYSSAGVRLISLMTTAAFNFFNYLEIVREARQAVHPSVALMANIGDFNQEQAEQLKEAGINIVYHAIRIGEGIITGLAPEKRRATIEATFAAGLQLMSGVEPVYQGQDAALVIERMLEVAQWPLVCTGVGQLCSVASTRMSNVKRLAQTRHRLLASILRLMVGSNVRFGGESSRWCNSGTNPRDTVSFAGEEAIAAEVAAARLELQEYGWAVPDNNQVIY